MPLLSTPPQSTGATFDETGRYRYNLWRLWDKTLPRVAFVMLNPSTADAEVNDPTIRRCIGFARDWGYGSLEVVNLFSYRATRPQQLKQASYPVGERTDEFILAASDRAELLVLAWGNWGTLLNRDQNVLELLGDRPSYCLDRNRSGQPRHPLYVSRQTQPRLLC
ncbi:MAG: DUF1643 domain-containing protein [Cyanobacteria bacterium P01_E01_bin.34]